MPRGRPFKKGGPSPNPGGRPRETFDLRLLARARTEQALAVLDKGMRSKNLRVAILAAVELLNRGYGKSIQPNAATDSEGRDLSLPTVLIVNKDDLEKYPDTNLPQWPVAIIPKKDVPGPETGEPQTKTDATSTH